MQTMQFQMPVRLHVNGEVHEIESVRQAVSFLGDWPSTRRGPVFACALNGCMAALGGGMQPEDARKAFESFARITGILVTPAAANISRLTARSVAFTAPIPH